MTNNPRTKVILFETWSRAQAHSLITGVSSPTSFASTDEFQAELRTNYHRLADSLNTAHPTNPPVVVAPVGDAWQNAGGLLPASDPNFVSLHGSDDYHGNNNGYYLAAAVIYSVIYGVSPHGLSITPLISTLNLGFTEDATRLEDVAWATVSAAIPPAAQTWLFDFGAAANTTDHGPAPDDPMSYRNNVTSAIGAFSTGQLLNLVSVRNTPTSVGLEMVSRFNGADENGTTTAAPYPTDATRDSLYGNTEIWNGLTDVFPSFRLTGLNPMRTYNLTFYASRTGVSDNREAEYAVRGGNSAIATLNPANNITNRVTVTGITPDASRQITVRLSPAVNNNNVYHFTYLGVMRVDPVWMGSEFLTPVLNDGQMTLNWTGSGQLEWAPTVLGPWTPVTPEPSPPYSEPVVSAARRFYRLKTAP